MVLRSLALVESIECTFDPLVHIFEIFKVELLVADQVDRGTTPLTLSMLLYQAGDCLFFFFGRIL